MHIKCLTRRKLFSIHSLISRKKGHQSTPNHQQEGHCNIVNNENEMNTRKTRRHNWKQKDAFPIQPGSFAEEERQTMMTQDAAECLVGFANQPQSSREDPALRNVGAEITFGIELEEEERSNSNNERRPARAFFFHHKF
jgi:protein required for attachment to host cells